MRILLDTTYFLPAIGILVKDLPRDALFKLMAKKHEIAISHISIFELSAKGAKYVITGKLLADRITRGITALVYDEKIKITPIHESKILLTAFKLRNMLDDFVECLILSSAINHCDVLVTEDSDILKLRKNKEFTEFLSAAKPHFTIKQLDELL